MTDFIMTYRKQRDSHPATVRECGPGFCRLSRSACFRFFMVICIALYSFAGTRFTPVIVHSHQEAHGEHLVEFHDAPEPDHHDEYHDGENGQETGEENDEGEHHHHLSFSGGVAMASVMPSNQPFIQRVMKLSPTSFDEVCPSGPVFELIKPPQVS
ncbi:MAG: hypothetical protein V4584_00565 [Verrucomicrobiota bacterium]